MENTNSSIFLSIVLAVWEFLKKLPFRVWNLIKAVALNIWETLKEFGIMIYKGAIKFGLNVKDFFVSFMPASKDTKISYFLMGYSSFRNKQYGRAAVFLAMQLGFILFMIIRGFSLIRDYFTLAQNLRGFDENGVYQVGDNGVTMLFFGVMVFALIITFINMYVIQVNMAHNTDKMKAEGHALPTFKEDIKSFINERFHITLLALPITMIVIFVVLPLIFMILISFTDYYRANPLGVQYYFNWLGIDNFLIFFNANSNFSTTFWGVLGWTLVWAIFATFLNYFAGIAVALIINTKGIRFKGVFRTCLVITIAVPQFVSLLVLRTFLNNYGVVNGVLNKMGIIELLMNWGILESNFIPFLSNPTMARITVIVANLWIGIPYTVLIVTGILMNIPAELFESAKIDGASPVTIFIKIVMPYILFVTAPYLITQFIGNINNFNVIFLLTGGAPSTTKYYNAGQTDLLITWLYKLTLERQDYAYASVIGIFTFMVCATLSLLTYRNTASFKREGDFA